MNVLISGGGTGGHVYPALAVVAQLAPAVTNRPRHEQTLAAMAVSGAGALPVSPAANVVDQTPDLRLLWVGSRGGMEKELIERAGIAFEGVSTGQLRVANPFTLLRNLGRMAAGVHESQAIIDRFRPDVCFVTGGYVCGPVVMACWLRKVPVLIYLPDMSPGYAIRMLSKLAARVAVSFPEVARWFGGEAPAGKAVITGYPVRTELVEAARDRNAARRRLAEAMGVDFDEPDGAPLPLLLVWGGSSGARVINRSTWGALPALLSLAHVVHVVGVRDWPLHEAWAVEQRNAAPTLAELLRRRYHPVAYLHEEMPLALAAADLSVARAGASTLGEFPVAKLPSVLAPLHSVNQMDNAQALAGRGGAVIVEDVELPTQLAPTVISLLVDAGQRSEMQAALAQMAQPDAALNIAREIVKLVKV